MQISIHKMVDYKEINNSLPFFLSIASHNQYLFDSIEEYIFISQCIILFILFMINQ